MFLADIAFLDWLTAGWDMSKIWFILFIIFIVFEVATSGTLVSIWFCFGSLAAMVAAKSGIGVFAQTVVCLVVSIALLILTKPFVKKILKQKNEPTNADRIIGGRGVVQEEINNLSGTGVVKIDGKVWSARSTEESLVIPQGREVEILRIQGVKVIVKEVGQAEKN